jgi:hypothetical protein
MLLYFLSAQNILTKDQSIVSAIFFSTQTEMTNTEVCRFLGCDVM